MSKVKSLFIAITLLITSVAVVSANPFLVTNADDKVIDINGKWDMTADAQGQVVPITLTIKQTKAAFTGTVSTPFGDGTVEDGLIKGADVTATVKIEVQGQYLELALKGKVDKGKMTGTMEGEGAPSTTFTAQKVKTEKKK